MEINWLILIIVGVFAVLLIAYLIKRDLKDRKKVTKFYNKDYKSAYEKDSELNDEQDDY